MQLPIRLGIGLSVALTCGMAIGQTQPWRGAPAGPPRPAQSQPPSIQQRPQAPPAGAPFQLTPQQQQHLDQVLKQWEQRSDRVKTFGCEFIRWEYDPVFGSADQPRFIDRGEIKYAAPDRGLFRVIDSRQGDKMAPVEDERAEHWVCDGKAIYQFDYVKKQVVEHRLPPEKQGKAIAEEGPLPFLFGAEAEKLKQRYFLRIVTPKEVQQKQIWLEAYPRFRQDAANFARAEFVLTADELKPFALQIYAPNRKNRTVYQFREINVNDPLAFLRGNPFLVVTPWNWQKVVEEVPTEQARNPSPSGATR